MDSADLIVPICVFFFTTTDLRKLRVLCPRYVWDAEGWVGGLGDNYILVMVLYLLCIALYTL